MSAATKSAAEIAREISQAPYEELDELLVLYAGDARKQVVHACEVAQRRREREQAERARVQAMYELMAEVGGTGCIVGVDEVGRGSVAGPLTVAAVCLDSAHPIWGINDSKQLSPKRREELAGRIRAEARAIGIAHIAPADIDAQGMATSLRRAMAEAVSATGLEPDSVLIDGNPVHAHPKERCIVKGDAKIASIAAASIVAKVTRDALMDEYAAQWPAYHFDRSKGYASPEHIAAIKRFGLTPIHRVSFCGNFLETPSLF